jgi:hypothetical protein
MASRLAFLDSLRSMHDVFHVYFLRHYVSDPTHVINMISFQVSVEVVLMEEPICILDHCIRQIRCRTFDQVKV